MTESTSVALDLIRWLAALLVFAAHFIQLGTCLAPSELIDPFSRLGVLIFFILSGYVIRYVAEAHHPNIAHYLEARFARITSVYWPALIVTVIADLTGRHLNALPYVRYPAPDALHIAAFSPVFLVFLSENMVHPLRWFSNGPLWSIAYEVWYYLLFGIAFYLRGRRRAVLLAIAALLAGLHILLLMPLWLIGGQIYVQRRRWAAVPFWLRWLIIAVAMASVLLLSLPAGHALLEPLRALGVTATGQGFHAPFLADYVILVPAALAIAMLCAGNTVRLPAKAHILIRAGAGFSFSLYAFHVPLVVLARSTGWYDPTDGGSCIIVALMIIGFCWLLSLFTERRKAWFRNMARWIGQKVQSAINYGGRLGKSKYLDRCLTND